MDLIEKYHFYINLKIRKDRNETCIETLKSLGISSPTRFNAIIHQVGYIGCVKSHIRCIELAKERKYPFVCIFEDDIVIRNIDKCKEMINKYIDYDYDVLYLGCNIKNNDYDFITDELIHVKKAECNHAYIIKSHYYDEILENYRESMNNKLNNREDDRYNMDIYSNTLQMKDKWYSLYPIFISQKNDYSNIAKREVNLCDTIYAIPTNNNDLPYVSLLTPTFNRKRFLNLMLSNINQFKYPKDKIEWNILESNDKGIENYQRLFNNDEIKKIELLLGVKIKYDYLDRKLTLGEKRNMLCESSSHDYLINMDDDDIYLPEYINYSIDILLNQNKDITSCLDMLFIYPMKDFKTSYIRCVRDYKLYHEAPLCMKKSHWEKNKYSVIKTGEGKTVCGADISVCGISDVIHCMICVCWDENTVNKDMFLNYPVDINVNGGSIDILKIIFNNYKKEINKNKIENINKDINEKTEDKKIEDIEIKELNTNDNIIISKDLLRDIKRFIDKTTPKVYFEVDELLSHALMINNIDKLLNIPVKDS